MTRCNSWRFTATKIDQAKWLPVGKNRQVWRPCKAKVAAGTTRCTDCETALILCPSTPIRKALVNEPDQNRGVLFQLTTDSAAAIAGTAARRLAALDSSEPEGTTVLPRSTTSSVWN